MFLKRKGILFLHGFCFVFCCLFSINCLAIDMDNLQCESKSINSCVNNIYNNHETYENKKIGDICFNGLRQTQVSFLVKELIIKKGDAFIAENLDESLQKIRNLRIFSSVTGYVTGTELNKVNICIDISEKHTLLPFFRVKNGGGSSLVVLGAGDLNAFGKGIEILASYENFNNNYHGGKLEYRIPNEVGIPFVFSGTVGKQTRIYNDLSDNNIKNRDVLLKQVFTENMALFSVKKAVSLGVGLDINREAIIGTPTDSLNISPTALLSLGNINYFDYRLSGKNLSFSLKNTQNIILQRRFWRLAIDAKYYKMLNSWVDFAAKTTFQTTFLFTNVPWFNSCSIGGFSEVRGFFDQRFRGNVCLFTNLESRFIALTAADIVVQPVAFIDAGLVGADFSLKVAKNPISTGTGVRFVFPFLARLVLRLDAAYAITYREFPISFSFGSVQFF